MLRGIHRRALDAMLRGRREDGRPYGQVINQAISGSMGTLFMIMSFMVLFAVLLKVMSETGILVILTIPLSGVFHVLGVSQNLVPAAVKGLFEIDLGSAAAAHASAPLLQKMVVVSAIVAWSGLSVHGQVASVLADTDISMKPYFAARGLHAVYAAVMTLVFFRPVEQALGGLSVPAFASREFLFPARTGPTMMEAFHLSLLIMLLSLAALAVGVVVVAGVRALRLGWLSARYR